MREEDIGPGAAGLRCAVARGHITGAVRQRAYAIGDLQTRRVSVRYVSCVDALPASRFKIAFKYNCLCLMLETYLNDFMIGPLS